MSYCVGRATLRVRLTMCVVCYAARDWLWVSPKYAELIEIINKIIIVASTRSWLFILLYQ